MADKCVSGLAGLLCAIMLCVPAWAATDDEDAYLAAQCPAFAKWYAAAKIKHERVKSAYVKSKDPPTQPDLRKELARRVAADQKARDFMTAHTKDDLDKAQYAAKFKAMEAVDADNLVWLKPLVAKQGFPTVAEVGKQGVDNAWLLVQHADSDPAFQASVLKQLNPRLGKSGISKNDYALLYDRVRVNRHKSQRYGTQAFFKNGAVVLNPVEDVVHLDQRRESMDLMPESDYMCVLRAVYKKPPSGTK